ncbi:hypothetical protein ACJDU8_01895 [Clostridium sp. WILCCON 0269]|uniref:Uncharacterized protein n=1 Tax=Candidatus Clostridium eludens TaxID=3381663 RepID=A0ABW8SE83_9CLOT
MTVVGFNVGSTLNLEDMSLAIDYLIDRDSFEPDLQDIKDKIRIKENSIKSTSKLI